MNGRKIEIKPTDVKVLGRAVSITTDKTLVAAEQTVDESFDPNKNYPGTFEDHSQWTINRLLKSKIDALSDGIPSDINPASTESYGIVRLGSGTNDPDDYDVVTMNLFRPVYGDVENNKTRLAKLEECCEEVQEFIKKKDVAVIDRIPNTTLSDEVWSEDGKSVTFKITADTGYYISDVDIDGLDIDVELTPNNEDYPTEYIVVITSENEIEYDIYVDGASKLIPSGEHTITVKGTGVKTLVFVVKSDQSDYISKMCSPVAGYQVSETYYDYHSTGSVPRDDRSDAIKYLPTLQNVQVVFSPHLTLDLFRVSVTGTLDQDIVVDTTDLYSKIAGAVSIFNQNCRVTLSQLNKQGMLDVVRYGEDISGTILVYEGYSIKKAIWRYHDEDGESTDIDSTGRDIQINNNKFIISNPGWDIVEDGNGTFKWKNIRSVDLLIVAEEIQLCSITYNGSNYNTTNNVTQVAYGDSYSTTITPANGYKIDSVTVTMNGTPINQAWDRTTGKLTIGSVTGPVVITVNTSSNAPQTVQYNVTYQYSGLVRGNVNFGGNNGQPINVVTSGNKYSCLIAPQSGYHISSATIKTTSGGQVVASTYSNNLLTSTNNITEDITVTITGGANAFIASVYPTGEPGGVGGSGFSTGDMPRGCVYGTNGYSFPDRGWAATTDTYLWGGDPFLPYSTEKYVCMGGQFYESTGGTGKIKILRASGRWTLSCESHYIDLQYGYGENSGTADSLLSRIKTNTLTNYFMDEVFGTPTQLTFSQSTGTSTGVIEFTAVPNNEKASILHIISVSVDGGIPASGEKFMKFYIQQSTSEQGAAYRSNRYTASPYSANKTIQHKFVGDWRRVTLNGDGTTTDVPANVLNVDMDYSGGMASLSSNSGTVSDMLTITSLSDEGPDFSINSKDRNNTSPKKIYFIENVKGEDRLVTFTLGHSSDEAGVDNTPILIKDSERSGNYISELFLGSEAIITGNTDPNADIHISGYGNTGTVSATIGNIVGLTADDITVKYVCPISYSTGIHGSGNDDEHYENVLWIPVEFTYADHTVQFELGSGMIAPAAGDGIGTVKNAPWQYVISLS